MASAVWFITTLAGGAGNWTLSLTGLSGSTPMGTAVGKVGEVIGTVAILVALNQLAGLSLGSAALMASVMHAGAFYFSPTALPVFLINLVTHGLAMGYLVFKMDNLWRAWLYHAACDLWLFIVTVGFADSVS
jgi:hypothetical protein